MYCLTVLSPRYFLYTACNPLSVASCVKKLAKFTSVFVLYT